MKHQCARRNKRTTEYRRWVGMIARCKPKHKDHHLYADRGISVCTRWRTSFQNFLRDMGSCPEGMQLDRTDNNKGYSPDNCKWVTPSQNGRNRSTNIHITINGITKLIIEWCEFYGLPQSTVHSRIRRNCPKTKWFLPARKLNRKMK